MLVENLVSSMTNTPPVNVHEPSIEGSDLSAACTTVTAQKEVKLALALNTSGGSQKRSLTSTKQWLVWLVAHMKISMLHQKSW